MVGIVQNKPFVAAWNPQLDPTHGGRLEIIARKIKNFILYLPNSLAATFINPRCQSLYRPSESQKKNGGFNKEIVTPDQVHLSAKVHVIEGASSETPTVILFNPLGANYSVHAALTLHLTEKKCNVVLFDHRGLGNTWRAEDFVVDGESVYQYVTQELGTKSNQVHFYGFSMGGSIAAQVKALHPESEGKYVGDRSFSSLFSLLREKGRVTKFGKCIEGTLLCVSFLFAHAMSFLGWEWDGNKVWAQLKGEKRVIRHPNDCFIPREASLASVCSPKEIIDLDSNNTGFSTHFAPLEAQMTARGQNAAAAVADFFSNGASA